MPPPWWVPLEEYHAYSTSEVNSKSGVPWSRSTLGLRLREGILGQYVSPCNYAAPRLFRANDVLEVAPDL